MSPHAARRPLRMRATPSWLIWKPFGAACGKALGDKRTPHGARRSGRLKNFSPQSENFSGGVRSGQPYSSCGRGRCGGGADQASAFELVRVCHSVHPGARIWTVKCR
jgi:hypothetical protein